MNRAAHTTVLYLGLALLLVLYAVHLWQLDAIERRLIALEQGGPRPVTSGAAAEPAEALATSYMVEDNAAIVADPANLLRPHTRPLVRADEVVRGGTLRRQFGSDPRGLNPLLTNGADVVELSRYFTNRLAYRRLEDPDVYAPELATRVTTADDGLTYVIELRRGVRWQRPTVDWASGKYTWLDGDHPFVADDYVFALDVILNPQVSGRAAALRNYFEPVASYRAIDDHTLEVRFKERLYTNLPQLLDLEPMPRWLYQFDEGGQRFDEATWGQKFNEHWYNNRAVGVGPYRFLKWEPGVVLEFERNADYWGETPSFDKLQMFVVKDSAAWIRKLKTGELDYTNVQPDQYRTEIAGKQPPYLGEPRIVYSEHPTSTYFYLGWNQARPIFQDKRVRTALTLALDREGLMKNVFFGLGEVISGPFPTQNPCYDRSIAPLPYDLGRAAALLDEAGWKDADQDGIREKVIDGKVVPLAFTLMMFNAPEFETVASVYREALLQIGVKLQPEPLEWPTQQKRMQDREFDAFTSSWALDWDIDLMQLWHSKEADRPGSSNYVGFRDADADRIAEALRRTFDRDERVALCHQFHALVADEQPYTFFFQRRTAVLAWDWLNALEYSLLYPPRDTRRFSFREARP